MKKFGFSSSLVSWFSSYLSNRSQFVSIGGGRSHRIHPTSGVPQGSILGPFLFIIFINDLLKMLNTSFGFADDLKLLRKIMTGGDCFMFQVEIDKLQDWCNSNKLDLNVKKCAIMSITNKTEKYKLEYQYRIGSTVIQRVKFKRDLGVIIDENLSFKEHINSITRKAYQMLGFIFRCGKHFKTESMLVLYHSLVRSRLEYCSTVWSPIYAKYNDIIEKVQRKFTRMYFFKFKLTRIDYDDRLIHLQIHSLKTRRLENDEITLYKIIHNRIDTSLNQHLSYYNHGRVSRRDQPIFYTPFGSSNIVRNEPLHRMQNHHDKYFHDINIFDDSFYSFKKLVKEKFDF